MPDRIVRSGILTSEAVCRLSWAAEVFSRRLHRLVDDFGRYDARPAILRVHAYPLQIDKVSEADIGKWMQETAEAGLVSQYHVDGKPFLVVEKFGQRLRAKTSKWPHPPSSARACQQMRTEANTETEAEASAANAPALPCERELAEAAESSFVQLDSSYPTAAEVLTFGNMGAGIPADYCTYYHAKKTEQRTWLNKRGELIQWQLEITRWWNGDRPTWGQRRQQHKRKSQPI
jgi:hypothetical protein